MAGTKVRSAQEIADELTAIAVEHLDNLSPEEREKRILAFERAVATSGRATDTTDSSSACTPRTPVHAREQERS